MNTAIEEIKTIINSLLTHHCKNVRTEYPIAFDRMGYARQIVREQSHEQSAVQTAIHNVQMKLEDLLNVKQIHGETMLNELTVLVDDMTNIMIAQKSSITPHKGGRTDHLPRSRVTPDERQRIDVILAETELSFADWVMEQVRRYEDQKANI